MIQTYKRNPKIDAHNDVILIGSGMGSLAAGAILAKEGKKVLILERHYTAGGYTHIFKRKGFEWDVGIHYIGDVHKKESPVRRMFDYVSNNELQWADMGRVYDRVIVGKKQYEFVKGVSSFKEKLVEYFPDEEKAIHNYVDLVFKANAAGRSFQMNKALPKWLSKLLYKNMTKPFFGFANGTTYEVLRTLTDNEELIKVLTAQYGDYGLPPKKSSFYMHAIVAKHYFNGGYFPVGGSSQIVETILPQIEATGGTLIINAEVEEIVIEDNKAIGVRMKDQRIIKSDKVISGAGIVTTYSQLISENVSKRHGLMDQLKKVNPSVAHACLYLGLEGTPEELGLPKNNFWIYPEEGDHDTCVENYLKDLDAPFPVVYVSFPAAKDPDWSNRYPGKSTIDIITLVPYEAFVEWKETSWMKRGEKYEAFKSKITERLLDVLYEQLPQVKGKIVHQELSSPLSTKHFMNYEKGEIYGLDHSPERFKQKFLTPRTPIKNLFLTGQDIATAGVAGALFSGLMTASVIMRKNLLKKIMKLA